MLWRTGEAQPPRALNQARRASRASSASRMRFWSPAAFAASSSRSSFPIASESCAPNPLCRAAFSGPAAPGFCELQFGPQLGLLVVF